MRNSQFMIEVALLGQRKIRVQHSQAQRLKVVQRWLAPQVKAQENGLLQLAGFALGHR